MTDLRGLTEIRARALVRSYRAPLWKRPKGFGEPSRHPVKNDIIDYLIGVGLLKRRRTQDGREYVWPTSMGVKRARILYALERR